jgi:hypothetical protein
MYQLYRWQNGPQSWSERYGEVEILDPAGTGILFPSVVQPAAGRYSSSSVTIVLTEIKGGFVNLFKKVHVVVW